MKFKNLVISLCLLASTGSLVGCASWIEEERQANYEQCRRSCNSVFAGSNQHYTMCMNSGLNESGYYNGARCKATVEPHIFCMNSGLSLPKQASSRRNAYSKCIIDYQNNKSDRAFIREQTSQTQPVSNQICTTVRGTTSCTTRVPQPPAMP